jgi:hypothetical protein
MPKEIVAVSRLGEAEERSDRGARVRLVVRGKSSPRWTAAW